MVEELALRQVCSECLFGVIPPMLRTRPFFCRWCCIILAVNSTINNTPVRNRTEEVIHCVAVMLLLLAASEHAVRKTKSQCCVTCLIRKCSSAADGNSVSGRGCEKFCSVSVLPTDISPASWQFLLREGTSENRWSYDVLLSCWARGFCCFKLTYCWHTHVSLGPWPLWHLRMKVMCSVNIPAGPVTQ